MSASVEFRERELAIALVDLARFTHAVAGLGGLEIADVIGAYYGVAEEVLPRHGGRIVKFLGDACLAVFDPGDAPRALEAVDALQHRVHLIGTERGLELELGANVHVASVAEGDFGLRGSYEIVGRGVMHTFRMGSGSGVRISEPVYRRLPSDRRAGWVKHKPPVTYTRGPA